MFALHHAIEGLDPVTAKSLLEDGAEVNASDPDMGGATALHLAVDIECEDSGRRFDEGERGTETGVALNREWCNAVPRVMSIERIKR